jgi:hypothetical protein
MRTSGIVWAVLLAAATSVQAAPIVGLGDPLTDPTLVAGTQQGFDAVAPGQYNSLPLGNVTYIGVDAPLTIGPDFNGSFNTTGGQSMFNDFDLIPAEFRFNFAAPINAFAFNWGAADNTWTLRAFNSLDVLLEAFTVPAVFSSNAGEYYGIATAGISYATLTDDKNNIAEGDYVFIDRFTTSDATVVAPEPGSLTLLGLGFASAVLTRRRRQQ